MRREVAVVAENKSHQDPRYLTESFVLAHFGCVPTNMLPEGPRHPDAKLLVSNTRTRGLLLIEEVGDARRNSLSLKFLTGNV